MHEFAFATSLVESAVDAARQRNSTEVLEVHLQIGKLRALSIEQVRFAYDVLARGTVLQGSKLIIEETNGVLRCSFCQYQSAFDPEGNPAYHFAVPQLLCPQCGNRLTILGGDECLITRIRLKIASDGR